MEEHIIVSGTVQDVCFRKFTQEFADKEGIVGYVMNLPNGTVEIVAQGTEEQLTALREAVARGPDEATVTKITVDRRKNSEEFTEFSRRHS